MKLTLDEAIAAEATWSDGYYNAIRFYFWEPELLGKLTVSQVRKAASAAETGSDVVSALETIIDSSPGMEARAFERIERTEEPFNHQLELFLRLAPKAVFDGLLNAISGEPFGLRPHVLTRAVQLVWRGTQPDILLLSDRDAVAIEVKPPHGKSFDGQMAKYAFLFSNLARVRPELRARNLVFLANGSLSDLLPRKSETLQSLRSREKAWTRARKTSAFKRLSDEEIEEICRLIDEMTPRIISFSAFLAICEKAMVSGETEALLLEGLRQELKRREYL